MPAVAAPDLEATIAAELAAHWPKLEQLIREQVRFALAELTRELVAAELAGRSNGNTAEHAAGRLAESPASPSKTCSVCRLELPLDAFTRDSRRVTACGRAVGRARRNEQPHPSIARMLRRNR